VELGVALGVHEREIELVEDLEELADQRLGRHVHRPSLLLDHPLAVVVELGLQTLQVLAVLCGLPTNLVEILARDLRLGHAGGGVVGPRRYHRAPRIEGSLLGPRIRAHPTLVGDLDPLGPALLVLALLAALAVFSIFGHPVAFTWIFLGFACSTFGTSTVSTPRSKLASIRSASPVWGSVIDRANAPYRPSTRCNESSFTSE